MNLRQQKCGREAKGIGAKKSENEKIKQSKWPIRIFKRGAAEREMVARE